MLLGFARALRAAGVPVTPDRAHGFLEAPSPSSGSTTSSATYWAGRATLCAGPDDLDALRQVFEAWFDADRPRGGAPTPAASPGCRRLGARLPDDAADDRRRAARTTDDGRGRPPATTEVLRHRDVATSTRPSGSCSRALFATLASRPHRPGVPPGTTPAPRGDSTPRRTMRDQLRRIGEPGRAAHWRRRRVRAAPGGAAGRRVRLDERVRRRAAAARAPDRRLAAQPTRPRCSRVGTRLTRRHPGAARRDADRALSPPPARPCPTGRAAPGSARRCGRSSTGWGQRGMARGAVVVVFSDGWERGDAALLGEQVGAPAPDRAPRRSG